MVIKQSIKEDLHNSSNNKVRTHSDKKILRKKLINIIVSIIRLFLIMGLAFVILYPILYMLSVSFRRPEELLDPTVVWIPKTFILENFKLVFELLDYKNAFFRTFFLSFTCTILQCFTCSLVGYGFGRFRFKGRNILFIGVILTLIVPPQSIMMPLFASFVNITEATGFPMVDTPIPMALSALMGTGIRAGLFIYLFRQFYKNMPLELEDAAYIDGCGPIAAYFRVIFPNTGAIVLVTFLLSLVWYWNDYFYVSLYYSNARPLSVLVSSFSSALGTARKTNGFNYIPTEVAVYLQTACLMFIAPILLIYLLLQKYFTQSVTRTGIVG